MRRWSLSWSWSWSGTLGLIVFGVGCSSSNAALAPLGKDGGLDAGPDGALGIVDAATEAPPQDGAGDTGASASDAGDGGSGGPALDPEIVGMIAEVSAANMMTTMTKLSGFMTRNTCSNDTAGANGIGDARDWIMAQFNAIPGLTSVALDPFTYAGCGDAGTITRHNVVAWKLGVHPDRIVVIGGHYDSRTLNVLDGLSPAPGANDSGSQSALVLEAARIMASHSFDATILFVTFAGEEQGLVGSASLSKGYQQYFTPNATIEAMFNNDIVGGDSSVNTSTTLQQFRLYSPGTPREIVSDNGTTDDTSPARGLMRLIGYWGGAYVPAMMIQPRLREDRPGRGSDHESFIAQRYPAVRFIETLESPNAGTVASHQHSPNDLLDFVTPDYAARVAQVVMASAASLARAPSPPSPLLLSVSDAGADAGTTLSSTITVAGTAAGPISVTWVSPSSGPAVDHYVLAARPTTENFYHQRVTVPAATLTKSITPAELGMAGTPAFFVSVAAVDAAGHESLFAYPEWRCDGQACAIDPDALDVTSTE